MKQCIDFVNLNFWLRILGCFLGFWIIYEKGCFFFRGDFSQYSSSCQKNVCRRPIGQPTKCSRLWGFIPWDCQMRSLLFRFVDLRHFGKMLFLMVFTMCFFSKFLCFFFGTYITEIIRSRCSPATPLGMTLVAGSDARSAGENGPMCTYHMVPGCYRPSLYLGTRKLWHGWVLFFLLACVEPYFGNMAWCLPRSGGVDLFEPFVVQWWGSQRKSC